MTDFRCVNLIYEQINPKGLKQFITEFSLKNGKTGTEIVTMLGSNCRKGIRTIERDCFGSPERVIDNVNGRIETYTPAPRPHSGVMQQVKGMPDSYLDISMDELCQY